MLKHGIFLICLLLILGCSHESAEMASAEISRSSGESRIETAGPLQASEPPQTSFSSSQSSGDPAPDSPTLAECGLQPIETLEVYRFWGDGEIYSHERIAFEGEQTLLGHDRPRGLPLCRLPTNRCRFSASREKGIL